MLKKQADSFEGEATIYLGDADGNLYKFWKLTGKKFRNINEVLGSELGETNDS